MRITPSHSLLSLDVANTERLVVSKISNNNKISNNKLSDNCRERRIRGIYCIYAEIFL